MAGAIFGTACSFVKGEIPAIKMRTAVYAVPGINGVGAVWLGYGDARFQIRAINYGTVQNMAAWASAMQSLQGMIGTIVSDVASYGYCLLVQVGEPVYSPAWPFGCRCEIVLAGERVG